MKRFIALIFFWLFLGVAAHAATGLSSILFTNLDRTMFTVDYGAAPTNMVHVYFRTGQVNSSHDGIRITNVSGATGASLWTNPVTMAWGKILAPIAYDYNFISTSNLYNRGVLVNSNYNIILSPGTNVLDTYKYSSWRIVGATTNPADSIVILKRGIVQGQQLTIQGADVTYFTIPAGADLGDGTPGFNKQVLNGDLIGSTNTVINFEFDGSNWTETGRYFTPGGTTNQYFTNHWTTVTVNKLYADYFYSYTNILVNGTNVPTVNPTIPFIPYKDADASFADSPWNVISTNSMGFATTNLFLRSYADLAYPVRGVLQMGYGSLASIVSPATGGEAQALAIGERSLAVALAASGSTAVGWESAAYATNFLGSTAFGSGAGSVNAATNGVYVGAGTGNFMTSSLDDTAIGNTAFVGTGNARSNVVVGFEAGYALDAPRNVTAIGAGAGYVEQGVFGVRQRDYSTFIGALAGVNAVLDAQITNAIAIGFNVPITNSNEIIIGNAANTKAYLPPEVYAGGVLLGASTTLPTNMVISSGASTAGQAAVYTDATGTNTAPSLLTITNGAINVGNVFADVRVYGAIMDGSDDTAALQAAVNSGRVVLIPAGTLTYTGTIAMKSGAGIVGQGIGVTILRKTGNGIGIKVDGTNNTTRLTDTILSGFTLQGDNVASAGDYGIVYHHANDHHLIENVEIRNCGDVGLFFKGDCFEIRGYNLQVVSNHGGDQILFQETPDAGGEDANDITINDVYVLPAASTRALHFTNACNGNIIGNLIIQSPAPEVEAISFDGAYVKNNWLRGVFTYDQVATNGATAFVVFNNASENIIDGFNGGFTGVPVFDFKTNAVRNVILNGSKSASPTYTARTDSGSEANAIINWQGNNSAMLTPDSVASLTWTWNGYSSFPGTNTMGPLTITNWLSSQVGLTINGFSGQTNNLFKVGAGGTNYLNITSAGDTVPETDDTVQLGSSSKAFKGGYFGGSLSFAADTYALVLGGSGSKRGRIAHTGDTGVQNYDAFLEGTQRKWAYGYSGSASPLSGGGAGAFFLYSDVYGGYVLAINTNGLAQFPGAINASSGVFTNGITSGASTFTSNQDFTLQSAAPSDSATNFIVNFDYGSTLYSATNNVFIKWTTNRLAGRLKSTTFLIDPNGADRNLSYAALAWKTNSTTAINTVVTNGTLGMLSFSCWGANETNVTVSYRVFIP